MVTQNDDGTFTMTVNGEEKVFASLDDLGAAASKGAAADEKFREAAAIKKELEAFVKDRAPDLELAANFRRARQNGDQEALVAAMKGLGYTDEELKGYTGGSKTPAGEPAINPEDAQDLKDLKELLAESRRTGIPLKSIVSGIASDRRAKGKELTKTQLMDSLKKDPDIARILKRGGNTASALLTLTEAELSRKFMEGEVKGIDEGAISGSARDVSVTVKRLLESLASDGNGSTSLGGTPASLGFTGKPPAPIKRPSIDAESTEKAAYYESRLREMMEEESHPETA